MKRLMTLLLRVPRWLLTVLCVMAILYLTLVPRPLPDNDVEWWPHTDKVVHALMFGGLYFCAAVDLWRGRRAPYGRRLLLALGVATFGGVIELLQGAMHMGRGADVLDLLADALGALLATLIA